jgi:hypothetical protein
MGNKARNSGTLAGHHWATSMSGVTLTAKKSGRSLSIPNARRSFGSPSSCTPRASTRWPTCQTNCTTAGCGHGLPSCIPPSRYRSTSCRRCCGTGTTSAT